MVDMILLTLATWCFLWLASKRPQTALLYGGGIVSAGYVAWQATGWVMHWVVSPANTAFLWLQQNLTQQAQAVAVLSQFVPPQPVDTGMSQGHWVSLHVARGLIFCAITLAVFATFVIVFYLRTAIWDLTYDSRELSKTASWLSRLVALVASVYLAAIVLLLATNIAWLRQFQALAPLFGQSLSFHLYASIFHPL